MYDLLVYWLITIDEEIACLLQSALLFPKLRDHFPCLIMLFSEFVVVDFVAINLK